jgi:hypothetical protein
MKMKKRKMKVSHATKHEIKRPTDFSLFFHFNLPSAKENLFNSQCPSGNYSIIGLNFKGEKNGKNH